MFKARKEMKIKKNDYIISELLFWSVSKAKKAKEV
jgi:hypothetical protein